MEHIQPVIHLKRNLTQQEMFSGRERIRPDKSNPLILPALSTYR